MHFQGNLLDFFIVFWAGVLVSFTPCVYPVIPLTASFIAGVNTRGTKSMGLVISLVYVLGLALTYSSFAVFAALTGKVFGQMQNNAIVFIVAANVLIYFGLAMFDAVPFPAISAGIGASKGTGKNLWTVLFFGMTAGLVVSPCTAPVLGVLLVYIASKQNVFHGASLMFVFSYGVGASLIIVGTFSGIIGNLPKSGPWLVRVKKFCGLILIVAAEYFLVKAGMMLL